jgi:hypothetical protein
MKLFISWSGDLSESLASVIREWLPNVIQNVRPYFTVKDIDKGARWFDDIVKELQQSQVGLICVTPDSLESSWIMFEAGAVSIAVSERKICPIVFAMNKTQLRGPLAQFQAIEFNKVELGLLMQTINGECGEDALSESTLEKSFNKWWPDLESNVNSLLKEYKPGKPRQKTQVEQHDEVMGVLRQIIDLRISDMTRHVAEDIFVNIYANIDAMASDNDERVAHLDALLMLARNVEYLHRRVHKEPRHLDRGIQLIDRLSNEKSRLESDVKF